MTIADSVSWLAALGMCLAFALIGAVWGAAKQSGYREDQYSKLVAADASTRTALRELYRVTGWQMPDLWDAPEPQPGRWDVFVAWIARKVTAAGGWVRARFRGPAEVGSRTPEAEPIDAYDFEPTEPARCPLTVHVVDPGVESPIEWVGDDPDPGPDTDEMPTQPGPVTQPANVIIDDEWKRESDARFQQMLAEIRGETVKEGR